MAGQTALLHSLGTDEVVIYNFETTSQTPIAKKNICTASMSPGGKYAAVLFWEKEGKLAFYNAQTGEHFADYPISMPFGADSEHIQMDWTADENGVILSNFGAKTPYITIAGKVVYPYVGSEDYPKAYPGIVKFQKKTATRRAPPAAEKKLSAEIVEGVAPGADEYDDRTLVLRLGQAEVRRFGASGYILDSHASPGQQYIGVNNRIGNSGDYLWILSSDGDVLKRPEDKLGREIMEKASVLADKEASLQSPEYQSHKGWINAVGWEDDKTLQVDVRTLHIIPNRDSLEQNIRVNLTVDEKGVAIAGIALVRDRKQDDAGLERKRLPLMGDYRGERFPETRLVLLS